MGRVPPTDSFSFSFLFKASAAVNILQSTRMVASSPPSALALVRPPTNTNTNTNTNRNRNALLRCSSSSLQQQQPAIAKHVITTLSLSLLLLSPTNQVIAAPASSTYSNLCHLADILKIDDNNPGKQMMTGMSAKDFDPARYSGRWFEVASLKAGFSGQGQGDCHCTQGVYTYNPDVPSIQVDTFCVHGSPDGYITGIRGSVQCLSDQDKLKNQTDLETLEMIREKCYLRFPTLPFIPKQPYDVIATDYDNFALVSGSKDKSFIQIYSRNPVPGPAFIEKYKTYLADYGYDPTKIKDTPQDCEVMSNSKLSAMMSMSGMQKALTNEFPTLELTSSVKFDPFTSVFETFKKLVQLYFK